MEREEVEAMWERIKALEENQLKFCKVTAYESILSVYNLAVMLMPLRNVKSYEKYMEPKREQAERDILNAKSVDEVIGLLRGFNYDCISFVNSMR